MRIFFSQCKNLLTQGLNSLHGANDKSANKKDKLNDGDGPGAGGGYKPIDSIELSPSDSDGPGAGGGYDGDGIPAEGIPSDGPGAGGGYDGDGVPDDDSDGPGAGGGYDDSFNSFSTMTGLASATWDKPITVAPTIDGVTYPLDQLPALTGEWYFGCTGMLPVEVPMKPATEKNEGTTN